MTLNDGSVVEAGVFERALLDSLEASVVYVDSALTIRYLNAVGRSRWSDALGQAVFELPWCPAEQRGLLESVLFSGEPRSFEASGYVIRVTCISRAAGNGLCLVARERASQPWQNDERNFLDQQLQAAVQAAQLGLWSWNLKTNEVIWNEQMYAIAGCDEPLTLPQWQEKLTHPDDYRKVGEAHARLRRVGPFEPTMTRIVRGDGETRWGITSGTVLGDERGEPAMVVGAMLDVTEPQRAAERLQQARRLEAVGHLTAGVAHNFNNMLMIIGPCLDALKGRPLSPEHAGLVQDAVDATQRASDIVRQLMVLAGQQAQGATRGRRANELVSEVVRICRRAFPEHVGLDVTIDAACWVEFEAGALEEVLSNVLLNARDAVSDQAQGRVRVEATSGEQHGGYWLSIVVGDNGPGMDVEVQKKIFEPFFTTKAGRGTGLGLSTSQVIVERAGGQLAFRSEPGRGTECLILVPAEPAGPPEAEPVLPEVAKNELRVLIIDDEPAIRRLLELGLTEAGVQVTALAPSPRLEAEVGAADRANVVLLDRSLGSVSGLSLLPMLRRCLPEAKILFFSGQPVAQQEAALVDGVLQKPIRTQALVDAIVAAAQKA